jgi:hypothetical protein
MLQGAAKNKKQKKIYLWASSAASPDQPLCCRALQKKNAKKNAKKNLPLGELCRLSRRTSKLGSEFGDVEGRCKKKKKKDTSGRALPPPDEPLPPPQDSEC